jgi:hypothetical protein
VIKLEQTSSSQEVLRKDSVKAQDVWSASTDDTATG